MSELMPRQTLQTLSNCHAPVTSNTVLEEFFRDAFRRTMYETVASLQEDLDA